MLNRAAARFPLSGAIPRRIVCLVSFVLISLLCCFDVGFVTATHGAETFPLYPCIRANVRFWEDVYDRYTTNHAILHDREKLSRIYTVVNLINRDFPGASSINELRIKVAKDKIIQTLTRLAQGQAPKTAEEKRIAALFGKKASRQNYADAVERIRLQIGQKDRFHAGVLRSGKYLDHYKRIFISHGLPAELAYLPHVESSFILQAHSKVGAAGLWQFTRSTGKEFMTVSDHVDERYDPYVAAHSAARLLKTNYNALQSWPAAITAYNCGRGGMLRALQEKGSYENVFKSYSGGSFGFASRNFYSEFLAAKRVADRLLADPKVRAKLEKPEPTMTLRLEKPTHVSHLRKSYNVSHEDFVRHNPALLAPVTSGKKPVPKGYLLRLPANTRAQKNYAAVKTPIAEQIQGKTALLPSATSGQGTTALLRAASPRLAKSSARPLADEVIDRYYYTVQRGDTALAIARQFNISSGELLAANAKSDSTMIRAGERLLIPARNTAPKAVKKTPRIKQKIQ